MVDTIQAVSKEDDFYIQNIDCVYKNFADKNLNMLQPSISIILGIEKEPPKNYEDKSEYLDDVINIIKYSVEHNAATFINIDEQKFSDYLDCDNVISLSLKNKQADYYLSHKKVNDYIDVVITSNINRAVINIRVNKVYEHNLMCILAAYAVAMHLGFAEYDLLESNVSNMDMLQESREFEESTTWSFDSGSNSIKLHWEDFNEFTGYHISCYAESGEFVKGMHVYEGNEYEFTNLNPNTKYIIKVRGYTISSKVKWYGAYMSKTINTKAMTSKPNKKVQMKPWRTFKRRIKAIFK